MNIDTLEGEAIYDRLVGGDYDAALHVLWWKDDIGPGGLLGAAGYRAPRFLELETQVYAASNPTELSQIYRGLTGLFQRDVPATFLYPALATTLASKRIHGLDGCPYRGDITQCMGDLSLEEVN
jgi:hypothetical protein